MSILTHAVFVVMVILAALAGFWGHQRQME
jgi:hypothetical protein